MFDGFTLYNKGAYTASYLYSWMMIETFLSKIWTEHVDSSDRSGNDKKALKDHNRWTAFHYVEMLSAINKMPGVRDIFNTLRRKRNEIVHDRREIDEKDAYYCLNISDKILRNRINTPAMPFVGIESIQY